MTDAGAPRSGGARALRRAAGPLLGVALLLGVLPSMGPIVTGAEPSPAITNPCPSPIASDAPGASPTPGVPSAPSSPPVATASAGPMPSGSPDPAIAASAAPAPTGSPGPSASPEPCIVVPSIVDLGRDGRLTLLLAGSDWRATLGGERLDVVLVMSLDPVTKRVVAVSLPRDLVFFPQARNNGGGDSGLVRVNSLYSLYRRPSLPHEKVDKRAMRAFERDVEAALRIEIDYWALARFKGFGTLIGRLGGVRVDIPERITDTGYGRTGAYFPVAEDYRLVGLRRCSMTKPCRNPLIYVRSRKGTVGDGFNSDFARARRQSEVVMAAGRRITAGGLGYWDLSAIVKSSQGRIWTDLPRSVDLALELVALTRGATLLPIDTAVFGPRKWAYEDDQTPLYTYRLRLDLVRAWMDDRLGTPARRDRG